MSKRINISYSIELSELEGEVQRLITNSLNSIEECVANYRESIAACNPLELRQYESIDQLRHSLSDIDFLLSDINAIINSYNSYRLQEQSRLSNPPTVSPDPERIKETLDNLRALAGESDEIPD